MRIDEKLLEQVKEYAERRHLTLTTLVEQHFVRLLEEEKSVIDAEQI